MSQQEIASAIGLKNPSVISAWETDLRTPTAASLRKLSSYFKVPVEEIDPEGEAWDPERPRTERRPQKRAKKNPREGVQAQADSTEEFRTPALEDLLSMMRNIPDQGPLMILGGALQSVPPERRLDFALHCANQARAFVAGRPATGTDPNR